MTLRSSLCGVPTSDLDSVDPDYDGAWIGGILPALASVRPPAWLPAAAAGASRTVLLVLDGLGRRLLDRHAAAAPTLIGLGDGAVTSTLPSTTVTGLTSLATSAPPSVHGMLGYRFRVGGRVLSPLSWTLAGGGTPPDPSAVQPVSPFSALPAPPVVVNRAGFVGSGFTAAHLRGAEFVGVRDGAHTVEGDPLVDPEALVDAIVAAARRARLVYAYDDRVDKVAHSCGLDATEMLAALRTADRLVDHLLDRLGEDVAVVVTADHGQLAVDPAALVDLEPLDGLVAAWAGEARLRSLHAAPGAAGALLAAARRLLGDAAHVLSREEAAATGWFGGRVGLGVAARLGDVVVLARGRCGTIAPDLPREADLRSMHGGRSADEMLAVLLAGRGRRPAAGGGR